MTAYSIAKTNEWQALRRHWRDLESVHTKTLFDNDAMRFQKLSLESCGLLLDYSKNKVTKNTIELLVKLAKRQNVEGWRDKMFSGGIVNSTENRAVLHTALRGSSCHSRRFHSRGVQKCIDRALEAMSEFVHDLEVGNWVGHTGKRITDVVNIGIGGSDLGPKMVAEALRPYKRDGIKVHFVSNIDGAHITDTVSCLSQETTLFIIASKSFKTDETLTNAISAREWLLASGLPFESVEKHFVAVSSNPREVKKFGIDTKNMFPLWDWVGGRYSLWSTIGLPIAIAIGMDQFYQLLEGANEMDQHFQTAELSKNLPVILALLGVWYRNFGSYNSHAILPYDQHMKHFAAYLQQADMESNGKSIRRNGKVVDYSTAPVVWGSTGTDGQHAYFQLLHQGTERTTCDFIVPVSGVEELADHHQKLLANCLAQSEALMMGCVDEQSTPYKKMRGGNPSNTILIDKLTPKRLGALIALYEHKIFVQGIIWDINSFDQWGVELGKGLAQRIYREIGKCRQSSNHDSSTSGLISYCLKLRNQSDVQTKTVPQNFSNIV